MGGAEGDIAGRPVRRSRLADLADMTVPASATPVPVPPAPTVDDGGHERRREFAALLGEFRRTAVLLPLGADDSPLVADIDGLRWLYAFSDEAALARFALARGDAARAWDYQRLLGARLLDGVIPAMDVPCGVALDVGSPGHEVLLPPVLGIVPDSAAVDSNGEEAP
ncbi:hypothetical protein ABT039_35680 [Streptomyces lasiicapitis]|uniref:hypothetical protein n=1 Tax=Streptomyces lasiicapitis TaxID=1923961 RepID=UPI0033291C74